MKEPMLLLEEKDPQDMFVYLSWNQEEPVVYECFDGQDVYQIKEVYSLGINGGARAYTKRYAIYENDRSSPMTDYVAYYESSPYYRFDKERPDFYESLDEGNWFGNGSYVFDADSFISLEYAKSVLEEYLTVHKKRFQKEAA
jgi:hypothetical protein